MTRRVYRSTDASAPVWSGLAGASYAVLKACLVTGYGAKAGAGWTEAFAGTNKGVLRMGGGNQRYLWIDDTVTATTMRVRGHGAMTALDTGTDPFPTDALLSGGGYCVKSNSADNVARPWMVIATETYFYLYVGYNDTVLANSTGARPTAFFGDIDSDLPGDEWNTLLAVSGSATLSNGNSFGATSATQAAQPGHFFARSYTQIGGAIAASKYADSRWSTSAIGTTGTYPCPVTGKMKLSPIYVAEATGQFRGRMPGCYAPLHALPGSPMDTFTGVGDLAGKEFVLWDSAAASTRARIAVEISDT